MKQCYLIFISLVVLAFGCAPKIYKNPEFDSKTAAHKLVAILPASVSMTLRPNDMKKISREQLDEMQVKTGKSIQNNMYSWFLRRSEKFKYTVNFLDVSKTNSILLKNDINASNMETKTKEELAALLGVDAVITTNVTMDKPMSEGAAVAMGVLLGTWGSTNQVNTSINIHDAKDGTLVWKYDYAYSGSVGSSTENLVNALMRNASKKFPYNNK